MIRINLQEHWNSKYEHMPILNPDSFLEYKLMREWLSLNNVKHRFDWNNAGAYLPDYVWINEEDGASTIFKLKYAL